MMVVMVLYGVWHGPRWTFVAFGALHGVVLVIERQLGARHLDSSGPVQGAVRRARTLLVVVVGWVFFASATVDGAVERLVRMVVPNGLELELIEESVLTRELLVLLAATAVFVLPRGLNLGRALAKSSDPPAAAARVILMVVILPISLLLVASGTFRSFIFFELC